MSLVRRSSVLVLGVAAALAAALVQPTAASADAGPPPSSMASMGDSITRAFNACGFFVDCPSRSFGTGSSSSVNSHYLRILRVNPAILGHNYNVAVSGSRADDMPGQASAAVGRRVQYVTMLIGANDACTSSEASMTPVSTFRGYIDTALGTLKAGLPNAKVAVISVPDIRRLWEVGHVSSSARVAWSLFGICRSMLANPTSTAQADVDRRARVRQRVVDYNAQLAQACAAYGPNCDFDDNAVFNYPFTLSQVSTWDYFHPNTSGQATLAAVSYAAGFNWR
ncbi:MAG TPA: SGNH/GDSL hydrolase family protein [Micromonosporaceae bacterium]|jgi:lysophospholipase L1-like esterase